MSDKIEAGEASSRLQTSTKEIVSEIVNQAATDVQGVACGSAGTLVQADHSTLTPNGPHAGPLPSDGRTSIDPQLGPLPPEGETAHSGPVTTWRRVGGAADCAAEAAGNGHPLLLRAVEPWPKPVDGKMLLDALVATLRRFVVLPKWAAETLALWIVHTFAFELREVTTYIGLESPEHRCGKTTLITVLSELAHRAVVASNVSSPAFFRVIEQVRPTLLIDEADTFLHGNEELRGILNSGYHKKTAFVLRAVSQTIPAAAGEGEAESQSPGLASFSCWCPKAIARIGRLPMTLADRCIVFRMQRKTANEQCERVRSLEANPLKQQCARFVQDHAPAIAAARPAIPIELNDRAADIWEPLLALADLAGGGWPRLAREAAVGVTAASQESNPLSSLLIDICLAFAAMGVDRMFSYMLVQCLNVRQHRPWAEMLRGKPITDLWLARQLKPYGIRPRNLRVDGVQAKGYFQEDMLDTFRRYIPKAEMRTILEAAQSEAREQASEAASQPASQSVSETASR